MILNSAEMQMDTEPDSNTPTFLSSQAIQHSWNFLPVSQSR
jgi:hypothetical protein